MPKVAESARSARREQIIAAAVRCFARAGYHVTTMADVATEAGVSKGTPYLYFPGKEALFIALYEQWDCGLGEKIEVAVERLSEPDRRSPRRVLLTVAKTIGAHVVAEPDTCRVLMEARALAAHHPAIADAVRTNEQRTHEQLVDLVAGGVRASEWPKRTDPDLQATLFTAGMYGLMSQWHLAPGSFCWEPAAEALVNGMGRGGA